MHLLLTRPDAGEDGDPLHAALVAAGHRVTHAPLLTIAFADAPAGTQPPLDGVQGLIVTSRNGLKAVARTVLADAALRLPLFAVGPATAALARGLGFQTVIEGPGTGRDLAPLIESVTVPSHGTLLHLAGDTLAFDFAAALGARGYAVRVETVYRTEPARALPAEVAAALRGGDIDGVVLMSPRTARVYAKLVGDGALESAVRRIAHFCLSEAVGRELADLAPVRMAVAGSPNSQEMLALVAREASDSR